jgi:hypothetical protein
MPFYPFEEKFDEPSLPVKHRNGQGFYIEVIGEIFIVIAIGEILILNISERVGGTSLWNNIQ